MFFFFSFMIKCTGLGHSLKVCVRAKKAEKQKKQKKQVGQKEEKGREGELIRPSPERKQMKRKGA